MAESGQALANFVPPDWHVLPFRETCALHLHGGAQRLVLRLRDVQLWCINQYQLCVS